LLSRERDNDFEEEEEEEEEEERKTTRAHLSHINKNKECVAGCFTTATRCASRKSSTARTTV
jgi:hypothetical protein